MTRPYCPKHLADADRIVDRGIGSLFGSIVVLIFQVAILAVIVSSAVNGGAPVPVALGWGAAALAAYVVGIWLWRRSTRRATDRAVEVLAAWMLVCADCRREREKPDLPPIVVLHGVDPVRSERLDQVLDRVERARKGWVAEVAQLDQLERHFDDSEPNTRKDTTS